MRIQILLVLLMMATTGWADEWNRFRGPNGSGISNATGLPLEFGLMKNMVWRQEVPFGRSSPILTEDRVLITGSESQKLITVCFDRKTGDVVWQREILRDRTQKIYKGNDTATPTPTSDGKNFFVFFPDLGLVSFDPAGNERWRLKLGPFDSFYGVAASPIVHGSTLVQVCDQQSGSFIIAVDKDTGKVRWRKERYKEQKNGLTEGFSTPIVWTSEKGEDQIIVSGAYRIDSYSIDTGEKKWWVGKQGVYAISSPTLADNLVYAITLGLDEPVVESWENVSGRLDTNEDDKISFEEIPEGDSMREHFGYRDRDVDGFITVEEWTLIGREIVSEHGLVAVRVGGSGDQTEEHLIWRCKKGFPDVSSPLVYRDLLYMVKEGGIVTSLNPATGEVSNQGRLEGAIEPYSASPVAADGKVYFVSDNGKVSVMKADSELEVLAVNDLEEECQATPAIGDGSIYIRTAKALYCFSEKR